MQPQPAPQTPRAVARPAQARKDRPTYTPPRVVSFAMDAEIRKASLSFNGNL
jgi:hypothetical protein